VHGVLLLDKPLGWSSNAALQKVKWLLHAEKAGHTGTLDPLATGVLPLCFGAATKFSQTHLDADKAYTATLKLGVRTSTADAEGEVISRRAVSVTAEDLVRVQGQFSGPLAQIPPMYSALKKDGKPLYRYAREGHCVEREPRQVTIHALHLTRAHEDSEPDTLNLSVECSKGTYIRTLGEDIGEALGCGAHLIALRRVKTGPFSVSQCIGLSELEAMDEAQRRACLLPVQSLLHDCPSVVLDHAQDAARFCNGLSRRGNWPDADQVAVYDADTRLLGSARVHAGELIAQRLLSPLEIEQIRLARSAGQPLFEESPS